MVAPIIRIRELHPLEDFKLKAVFEDGRTVIYDMTEDISTLPGFAALESEPGLFESVQLDESRTCVFWSDEIDLPSHALYEHGEQVEREQSGTEASEARGGNA